MRTHLLFIFISLGFHSFAFASAPAECKTDEDCKVHGENLACRPQKTGCPGHESDSTCVIRTCQKVIQTPSSTATKSAAPVGPPLEN